MREVTAIAGLISTAGTLLANVDAALEDQQLEHAEHAQIETGLRQIEESIGVLRRQLAARRNGH